jgi:DNA adenine methylase
MTLVAPFPYFGGKRNIVEQVWSRLGVPKHYIEPFCGSAAMLLGAPRPASLEVVNDGSGFIANFWRAVKYQPDSVADWADYPVSHIDLHARHGWLMGQRERVGQELLDPDWPGDAKVAGWWLWGQCCWIGPRWCRWERKTPLHECKIPHLGDAGMGIQAVGKVPLYNISGADILAIGKAEANDTNDGGMLTSSGMAALIWMRKLADRLNRVRIIHGDWSRCLNHRHGGDDTAVFLDPPYRNYEKLYGNATPVADAVEQWARDNSNLRIALCGHKGDYDLKDWDIVEWDRGTPTYGGSKTTDKECVWYSPACLKPEAELDLFSATAA